MKTQVFAFSLSFLMAAVACQQTELSPLQPTEPTVLTFTADLVEGNQTRTQIEFTDDSHFNVLWNPGESINIFYGDTGNSPGSEFVSQNQSPSTSASFTGTINSFIGADENGQGYSFWGVYPYSENNRCDGNSVRLTLPTIQTAVVGNVDNNILPMVAKASGLVLPFYNVWSVFRIKLTNADIKSITFRGNNGEVLSGQVSVTMGSDGKPAWSSLPGEGKTYVTLKAPEGTTLQANQYYYIAFLPQTFSNGFTFSFHKESGEFGQFKYSSSKDFERSKWYPLNNKDSGTNVTYSSIIDMGNGLKFANMNIGETTANPAGDLFAWGETTTKSEYSWDNYFWGTSSSALTKYTTRDHKTVLDPEDDPATVICGEDWRTPTKAEWDALVGDGSGITYSDATGSFIKVTSSNGNHITLYSVYGGVSYYWSSDHPLRNQPQSISLKIANNDRETSTTTTTRDRYLGSYIRPIYVRVPVTAITLDQTSLVIFAGQSVTLTPNITPSSATKKNVRWESDNTNVATVDENGVVTAVAPGTATITATTVDGGFPATCDVTVYQEAVWMGNGYWATTNLGADQPEENGDMYAWGETETKSSYTWANYKWMMNAKSDGKYITKYQFPDGNTEALWYENGVFMGDGWSLLRSSDDVAKQNLGGLWHIPSRTQWEWLRDNCDWTYDSQKQGYWVTSRASGYEGNKIFLPANDSESYWTDTVDGYDATMASTMIIRTSGDPTIAYQDRYLRGLIRPIYYAQSQGVNSVTLNKTTLTLNSIGESEILTAAVSPDDILETSVVWSSSNVAVATVDGEGKVTAVDHGTAVISARSVANHTMVATCSVSVVLTSGTLAGHPWVDMGNGIKWSTTNLGTQTETSCGFYYAWGETQQKAPPYSWDTYEFKTQYFGFETLPSENDAASVNWGGGWRMPTYQNFAWLLNSNNCINSWVENYNGSGTNGRLFISLINGNRLFFPETGYTTNMFPLTSNGIGLYWSSTPYGEGLYSNNQYAWSLHFYHNSDGSGNILLDYDSYPRYTGIAIRPVADAD